jgi:hypothetical protein
MEGRVLYVLKMDNPKSPDDTGAPTRVRLIGPFADRKSCAALAVYREPPDTNPNNPHDNPCWQVVDLNDTTIPVVAP